MISKRVLTNPYLISSTELNSLPVLNFTGRIKLIDDEIAVESQDDEESIRSLLSLDQVSSPPMIGVDTESKPSALYSKKRNKTAMIQLASESACVIWRTRNLTKLPPSLISILSDERVLKIGQGIGGDVCALKEDFGCPSFNPRSFIDLYKIALRLQCNPKSLKGMVGIFLRKRLLKDMRISNWEQPILRHEQIQYAALDAWASRSVAIEMQKKGIDIRTIGCVDESDFQQASHPDHVFDIPSVDKPVTTPSVDQILSSSTSTQVKLVEFCVSQGHALKLIGFEKDVASNGRFRCVFECRTNSGETIRSSSINSHSSIRSAQEDAASVLLARLEMK